MSKVRKTIEDLTNASRAVISEWSLAVQGERNNEEDLEYWLIELRTVLVRANALVASNAHKMSGYDYQCFVAAITLAQSVRGTCVLSANLLEVTEYAA